MAKGKKRAKLSASVHVSFRVPRSMLADWKRAVKANGGNASACAVQALAHWIERKRIERAHAGEVGAIVTPVTLTKLDDAREAFP